ncbi:hypothetical protein SSX86_025778 [Deinandra increscens subsp. villosa]|uniref:MAR-binding filament-like protein 1-1 n=1 Tax=Deinandra increscens subsp. villosa TaxID=3103831 RepID=A0AAP0CK65_9ASTR
MGLAMGGSPPLHSPSYHPLFPSISSSSHPRPLYSCHRRPHDFSKARKVYSCIQNHDHNDDVSCQRRSILFMGISFLPFLNLKARALENLAPDESGMFELNLFFNIFITFPPNLLAEYASSNPLLTLLNGLGIIGSGVLGAFYALDQKEKSANIATIESMNTKLAEMEAAIVSMQKSYGSKVQKLKEEKDEQIRKSNQEKQSLMGQLSSANNTVTELGQELQKEEKMIQDLKNQINCLTPDLKKAADDEKELQMQLKDKLFSIGVLQERINLLKSEIKGKEDNLANVSSALAVKESEFKKLSSMYEETVAELTRSKSTIESLKQEIFELEKEIELKSSNLDGLNAQISSLRHKKDVIFRELESYKSEYNELKIYSEKQADSDAKLLEESGKKLEELQEKVELTEMMKKEESITMLSYIRDNIRKAIDSEVERVKEVENELQATQKTLEDTRNEAAELSGRVEHSQDTGKNLEEALSRVQTEFSESKTALHKNIDSLKQTAEMLTTELGSTKDAYVKAKEKLNQMSVEIQEISGNRDSLSKELAQAVEKLENAVHELEEEKKNVGSLTKEVNSLKAQMWEDNESRKSMESDLEEATKAFGEMSQNTKTLSQELEISKTKISGLEDEKEVLYRSLDEQKRAIQEARENMEDAHSVIVKLGKERENSEKKRDKLEKELAAAKGEILRIRSELSYSKPTEMEIKKGAEENAEEVNKKGSEDGKPAAVKKKVGRRKKVVSQQKDS